MKYSKEQVERSRAYLLDTLKINPGDTIYTKVNHVSRSGMSRNISVYVMRDNSPVDISTSAATVLGNPIAGDGGVKMVGCGMDMGFALVYDLSWRLFPEGFKVVGIGRNGDKSGFDKDGGYAMQQRWL